MNTWTWTIPMMLAGGMYAFSDAADSPPTGKGPVKTANDIELVEKLNSVRKEYHTTLAKLGAFYAKSGDTEKQRWTEDELKQYHRMMKYAYRLEADVPAPVLQPKFNITEANDLFREAMTYKDKGYGTEAVDNQRRAELLLKRIFEKYPESDKIAEAAYQLGDIYERYKPTPQYHRSVAYYERSFQWNKTFNASDARLKAARIYDKNLQDRGKAKGLYQEIIQHDTDNARVEEARRRLAELQR